MYMPLYACVFLILSACSAMAQNFAIPPTWRLPESSVLATIRLQLAKEAIAPLIRTIQPSNGTNYQLNTWESANLIAVIANNDYLSRTTVNENLVLSSLAAFGSSHPLWYDTQVPRDVVSDSLMWGLASYYAARAYGSDIALNYATQIWTDASQYFVYPGDAVRGSMDRKSGTFSSSCSGYSTAGAVFWQASQPADYQVNGETIGAFVALSAHLCEATSNSTYCESATLSAEFMQALMYNGDYIIDTIFLDTCETNTAAWSYNTAFLLEGLAVLLSTPSASGATSQFGSFMKELVASSIVYPLWTQSTGETAGVMIENDNTPASTNEVKGVYKTIFIRGLHEIWMRSAAFDNIDMTAFIEAFLMVQYNAVLQLATDANISSNVYSPIWIGPAVPTMLPWGQIPAVEVLNAAILENTSSSSSPSSSHTFVSSKATATASAPGSLSSNTPSTVSQPTISSHATSRSPITLTEIILSSLGGVILLGILGAFGHTLYKRGWTGVKDLAKTAWANRGTNMNSRRTGSTIEAAQEVEQTPRDPASAGPSVLSGRQPGSFEGSSTIRRPEFVQGSSRMGGMEEVDAHGISIVSR
ncbi:hypothetical protein PENSPDRAFT_758461 [Peniophora sp. CONT]|nr:hypothetical protein PENSPDRAFT_758461 [Peniophora sp. CONT]